MSEVHFFQVAGTTLAPYTQFARAVACAVRQTRRYPGQAFNVVLHVRHRLPVRYIVAEDGAPVPDSPEDEYSLALWVAPAECWPCLEIDGSFKTHPWEEGRQP